jgi:hypothetical protein
MLFRTGNQTRAQAVPSSINAAADKGWLSRKRARGGERLLRRLAEDLAKFSQAALTFGYPDAVRELSSFSGRGFIRPRKKVV